MLKLIVIAITALLYSGCIKNEPSSTVEKKEDTQNQMLASGHAYLHGDGKLKIYDIATAKVEEEILISPELSPITFTYGKTFSVSDDGGYVVWFVPDQGLVRWKKSDGSVKVFYKPTEWFKENPYFQFYGTSETIVLIDKRGSEIVWVNPDTTTVKSIPVPYPFGTIFSISLDLNKILYVEGYRQTVGEPSYLVTDINGATITSFKTKAEIADRSMIAWDKDSSGIITVENSHQLVKYPLQSPTKPEVLVEIPNGEIIVQLEQKDATIFIVTKSSWYAFDLESKKIINKLPLEAMAQLHRPRFIALSKTQFYIEEDVRSYEQLFKRLWISDWMGNKSIVVPEYGKRINQVNVY